MSDPAAAQVVQGVPSATVNPANGVPPTEAAHDAQADAGVPDIVVTAERRTQNLQNVPISATVLNGQDLITRGVNRVNELQNVAPSLSITTRQNATLINIRGVGASISTPVTSSGVATYVDGQLIGYDALIGLTFFDIGSVEVLRGPQGTLTGQNSTGGAVYIRTTQPAFKDISGYVDQTFGNYDQYRTAAALNLGFSDNVALRISGVHDERSSFTDNIGSSPSNPGNVNVNVIRANLALRDPNRRIEFNLRGSYFSSRNDNNPLKRRNDTNTDPFVISEDAISFQNIDGYTLSGELRYKLTDAVQLRAIASRISATIANQQDNDHTSTTPSPTGAVSISNFSLGQTSAEVNLLSSGSSNFQYVVGGFYLKEDRLTLARVDLHNTITVINADTVSARNFYNTTSSFFGQVTYKFSDLFDVLAGGRYSWNQQIGDYLSAPLGEAVAKSRALTGKVSVNFHPSSQTLIYGTFSRGFKAGGVNSTTTPNFDPERNTVYEVGMKTTLFDRHLRVNGDVFYSDNENVQINSFPPGSPSVVIQNAAQGRGYGAELELTGKFGEFSFNIGTGYLNNTIAKDACLFNADNPAGTRTLCPSASATQASTLVKQGSRLPFAPDWTINAGLQYTLQVGKVKVTPRGQWSYLSQQLATVFPSSTTIIPGRSIFDARVSADLTHDLRLEVFATNITNKIYIAAQVQSLGIFGAGGYQYGAPRQFGARALYSF